MPRPMRKLALLSALALAFATPSLALVQIEE